MSSFIQRFMGRPRSTRDFDMVALQLRVIVALAATDSRIDYMETEELADFVARGANSERDHEQLTELLHELVASPPSLEELLPALEKHSDFTALGRRLVIELEACADADGIIDHREAYVIDMVCDVFGVSSSLEDAA